MTRVDGGGPPGGPSAGRLPRTVEAYLTAVNLEALAREGLAPHEEQALAALQAAAAAAAPPVTTGAQLYDQLNNVHVLTTGCQSIDAGLLRTGLRTGQVLEICGESATGKTQLCLAAAVHAAGEGKRVVYVDTSNAVSGRRLEELAAAQQGTPQAVVDPLKFIGVRRCYDAHSLLRLLDELAAQQAQQAAQQPGGQQPGGPQPAQQQPGGLQDVQQQPAPSPQQQQQQHVPTAGGAPSGMLRRRLDDLPVELLVVDCLSAVITPVLGGGAGQHSVGHALLAAAAVGLKAFADGGNAAVLVTNHMVGGSDERRNEKRPAMGESWRNQPHVRIQLWRPPPGAGSDQDRCTATLRASGLQAVGTTAYYYLGPAGLTSQPLPGDHAAMQY